MALEQTVKNGIICSALSFAYSGKHLILDGLDLTIPPGEKIAVIGPNGAGKTTLLTLLSGLRKAEGNLQVDGLEKPEAIRQRVGLVFQNPDDQLFCRTVYEDIAFGPRNLGLTPSETELRVQQAIDTINLQSAPDSNNWQLSFGERKLVALAATLAMQPRYLALDEPTANLDPLHRRRLINWLQQINSTLIIATHDLDMLIGTCSRVLILDEGQIYADGATEIILKDEALLKRHGLELPLCLQPPRWNHTSTIK